MCRFAVLLASALIVQPAGAGHATSAEAAAQISGPDIAPQVRDAAQRFGIPEAWIYAVIRIESAGRVRAVSRAGAMGLMQLMPGTWARQRARFGLGADPFDPRDNIIAGTSYLREMHDRYGAAGFLAAYNAGPGRYEEWRDRGRPLPRETRRYVAAVTQLLQPDRGAIAAAMPAAPGILPLPPRGLRDSRQAVDAAAREALANPFARPLVPRHDLFAPVTTTADE